MVETLTMDDVKSIKHNLDYEVKNDFQENYGWNDDQILKLKNISCIQKQTDIDDEVCFCEITDGYSQIGYGVLINGKVDAILSLYEPQTLEMIFAKKLAVASGHDKVLLYFLETKEIFEIETR